MSVMKNLWIIANWKSNKSVAEALEWVSIVGPNIEKKENLKVVVCPTFTALPEVKKAVLAGSYPLLAGAQDLSPFGEGAYTGEEPASVLKQFVELAILGHSERRYNFAESDELVEKKVKQANEAGITSLVCVQGKDTPVPSGCQMIAYEPIDAISTGLTNTPGIGQASDPSHADNIAKYFKDKNKSNLQVIYGGSVTGENAKSFLIQNHIDGVLVGNASLDANEFLKIISAAYAI